MKNKVYIAIGIRKDALPEIIGIFWKKQDAEDAAYAQQNPEYIWENVIEKTVE